MVEAYWAGVLDAVHSARYETTGTKIYLQLDTPDKLVMGLAEYLDVERILHQPNKHSNTSGRIVLLNYSKQRLGQLEPYLLLLRCSIAHNSTLDE